MEVLCTVIVLEHLTGLRKQGLDMFPDPLGPITDDAQAHLLFCDHARLFDLFEGLAQLLLVVHWMPTPQMDDAIPIEKVETKVLRIAPLTAPPRSLGPLASPPRTALAGAGGPRRDT